MMTGVISILILTGCVQPAPNTRPWLLDRADQISSSQLGELPDPTLPVARDPNAPHFTPTPDAPRTLDTPNASEEQYIVQAGDYLAAIAQKYNIDLDVLINANPNIDPNWLEIGQLITIPAMTPSIPPSDFKIIPDSELVYGPVSSTLDIEAFINQHRGYLMDYSETIDEKTLTGAQIVERISYEYSVNPRLLLALLEYRSGWVTSKNVNSITQDYPMQVMDENRKGLYRQLAWTADKLNRGYYLWKIGAISYISFNDGGLVMFSPIINAGTAGVQYMLGVDSSSASWQKAVSESGVYQTYVNFFGIPFDLAIEPLIPGGLSQPQLSLPFEEGSVWSFTGGPHTAWGDGSAWAALDFAPPGDQFGCFQSNDWVTAVADGVIVRSGDGAVVLDLDGDGLEQTGWTILYMHIESRDRIAAGTQVKTGTRIGHPSCEGGVSNGTHVHIARRYNGEWISADTDLPFVLSGWTSAGEGIEYNGTLSKDGQIVYSWDGRIAENQIQH